MRKSRKSATKLLIATIVLTVGMSFTSWAADWIQDSNGWKYGEYNGYFMNYVGGWKEIDGKWYLFDHISGYMQHDIVVDGYTIGSDGAWDGNTPIIPEDTNKGNPYVPQYKYSFLSGGPNTEYVGIALACKFKVNGSYLKNQWVRIYSDEGKRNAYVYVGNDGVSLKAGESHDGFMIDETGFYVPATFNQETGKRALRAGDTIISNIDSLEERVDTNGNTYYLIGPDTNSISFKDNSEIDADSLLIDFTAYKYNPDTNTIYVFSNDGTAIYEDFEFDKEYDLKIPNTDLRGTALVEYCKQNNILIRVDVNNKTDGIGVSFLYCYK
ncbi:MAG: hypothetical protein LUH21_26965 [Clostridiales bacterium]|nr:hypothetical protein [Clostridiales bacterium]